MSKNMALAVIGAAYGDEGKGLMTDILANEGADIVVRSNGGAQAGHTVTTPNGNRHVFHHFGSGALSGLPSHMSQFFVSHPILFLQEYDRLNKIGANTHITIDPRSIITTPYDMMINQFIEQQRANNKHGSCGVGFGEAIERSLVPEFNITIRDLFSSTNIKDVLIGIREKWVYPRLQKLNATDLTPEQKSIVDNDNILDRFIQDCEVFKNIIGIKEDRNLKGTIIFEGAQGLLLDQDYGAFPHVTRSNTGLLNMATIAREAGIDTIKSHYMTRSYTTRHGAGPLSHDTDNMDFVEIIDETNIHNDWQGTIRAAPLDLNVLRDAINHDINRVKNEINIQPNIAITCLDQIVKEASIYNKENKIIKIKAEEISNFISNEIEHNVAYESWRATR